jgi:ribose transport system permease protein
LYVLRPPDFRAIGQLVLSFFAGPCKKLSVIPPISLVLTTIVVALGFCIADGPDGGSPANSHSRRNGVRRLLNLAGPFLGLALVIGLFSLNREIRSSFLSGANFKIILTQTVIVAVGTLGMTLIIVSGGIDLSVGSVVALSGVVGATALVKGNGVMTAVGLGIGMGALVGFVNGVMIGGLRMMPFIVTLGMMGMARGVAKWLSDNQTVNPGESSLDQLMALSNPEHFWPLPMGVWIALALAVIMALVMRQTVFGRYVFALGANESAARLSGIRVRWQKVVIYSLGGVFFGLSGVMQLSRLSQGDPTVAIGLELDIIAAVVIGGASLNGGTGSILGSLIGALIMAVLRNGANQMNWHNYMQEIIIGGVIIIAVALDKLRQRRTLGA